MSPQEEEKTNTEEKTEKTNTEDNTTPANNGSSRVRRRSRLDSLLEDQRLSLQSIQEYTEEELMGHIEAANINNNTEHDERELAEAAKLRRLSMRVSNYAETVNKDRLVEVRLSHVFYRVPIKADTPTVPTVWNATPLYKAYRFFRRIHRYRINRQEGAVENGGSKWIPQTASDIFQPYETKTILHNINLVLKPGNSYLILGPPGCGKTSLLKTIAGSFSRSSDPDAVHVKTHQPYLEGRIAYNGVAAHEDPRIVLPNICSYVQERDVHAPRLTIRETFNFAFQCRTGGKHSNVGVDNHGEKFDREQFTSSITMESLGLAHVADTFVGDEDIRGISGGQRRRVTVGEMMQSQSPVTCADEISTGLDAAVAYDICRSIVTFAKASKTTRVMSLLQPGPEVFSLFDEVIILSEGYLVYAGPIENVVEYFEDLGYKQPATVDVADFLQSLPTPDGALYFKPPEGSPQTHYSSQGFAEAFDKSEAGQAIQDQLNGDLLCKWEVSKSKSIEKDDDEETAKAAITVPTPADFKVEFHNSFSQSTKLNLWRHITLWKRDIGYIIGRMGENVGMAVATGGILFGDAKVTWNQDAPLDENTSRAVQKLLAAIFGALYMTTFFVVHGANVNAPEELDDRGIHYKHANANFYQSSSFVIGRLVATFPQRAIDIAVFGLPLYWMVGLHADAGAFFVYLLLLFFLIVAEKILFGITVALVRTKQNILGIGSFIMLLQLLFSGFIVFPDAIPGYYDWIYYLNPMAWAFQGLLLNEFLSDKYADGESLLASRGFRQERAWIGWSFAYLGGLSLVSTLGLAYALKVVRFEATKPKRSTVVDSSAEDSEYDRLSFSLPFTPVDLTFENVEYEVTASTGKEKIKILKGVSGCFRAGRLCALMGSSGAGKTTLMDVIAMRKESGTVTGEILLNGFEQERTSFLRSSGYVEQFDVQSPELTVRETIAFSARLRLDSSNPALKEDEDKLKFVDGILKLLELEDIENVQVGSYEEGGLAFEQRKRLAIAVELAGSPSILFLDEPTSGLDARAAILVVRLLKRITDTGRTVCSTIHQPSSAVFEMFDDLLLLETGGRVVFSGELGEHSAHLIDYFEFREVTPIDHGENPASWMLRVLSEKDDWNPSYLSSFSYEALKNEIAEINASPDESTKLSFTEQYPTTWSTRMHLMYKRITMIFLRSPAYNLTRLGISLLYAFILGSIFIQKSATGGVWTENQAEAVLGTMFLSLSIMGVTCITMVVPVMKRIRDVFYKHRASGMIEQSPLAWALSVGEAPYICAISLIFGAVYYGTVGLFQGWGSFGQFWLFFSLNLAIYTYMGQAFMCLVKDTTTAGALMGALIGYNVFFSGFVVRPQYFVGPFQIGYWTAPGRFAFEGLVISQFTDVDVELEAANGSPYFFSLGCTPGQTDPCLGDIEDYVKFSFGGKFKRDHFWIDFAGLAGYVLIAWIATTLALKKFNYVNT